MQVQRIAKKTPKSRARPKTNGAQVSVQQVMTKRVTTARAEMSLSSAMEVMVDQEISHLPVVDADGTLIGILSKTDLVRDHHLEGENLEQVDVRFPMRRGISYAAGGGYHQDTDGQRLVSDAMTTRVKTVLDSAPLVEAATLMSKNRIHGLPVVNAKKRLVGFLSTFDIVDWIAAR